MRANRIDPNNIDLDYLKQEFNRFRSELAGMKEKLGVNAADALDQMGSYLNGNGVASRLSSIEAELQSLSDSLKDKGKFAVAKLETEVSNRPLVSVAAAFGVGLLAAQFLRRK